MNNIERIYYNALNDKKYPGMVFYIVDFPSKNGNSKIGMSSFDINKYGKEQSLRKISDCFKKYRNIMFQLNNGKKIIKK